jgi:hypothetical protein
MTKHKATPNQRAAGRHAWACADTEALDGDPAFRCIMELRARVEALEGSATEGSDHIGEVNKMVPDGSLVERVAYAITGDSDGPLNWKNEAHAAIHAIANWLDQQELHVAATRLRMEVE